MRNFLATLIRLQMRFIAWQLQFTPALAKEYEKVTKPSNVISMQQIIVARLWQQRRRSSRNR
jgi:hypothetical protein